MNFLTLDCQVKCNALCRKTSSGVFQSRHLRGRRYYTSTSSFFEFCQNPTGSFEQVVNTINDYKNEARDYKNDLDYIFED